eukprot:SAG22_NODE_19_length_32182_cov_39.206963_19_plen_229_part_00
MHTQTSKHTHHTHTHTHTHRHTHTRTHAKRSVGGGLVVLAALPLIARLFGRAPIYYAEIFGLSPVAIGKYLSAPLAMAAAVGNGLAAAAETFLLRRGMLLLQIRRALSWVGHGMQAGALLLFVLARTPMVATVGYFFLRLGQCFHGSGANASYLEVGGPDTAILMAVGNTLASIPGMVIPPLGVYLKRRTGSWIPLFSLAAAVQFVAAGMYSKDCSLEPARDIVARAG